jgi:hypothetical protein
MNPLDKILSWWNLMNKGGLEVSFELVIYSDFPWVWIHLDITPYKD